MVTCESQTKTPRQPKLSPTSSFALSRGSRSRILEMPRSENIPQRPTASKFGPLDEGYFPPTPWLLPTPVTKSQPFVAVNFPALPDVMSRKSVG